MMMARRDSEYLIDERERKIVRKEGRKEGRREGRKDLMTAYRN